MIDITIQLTESHISKLDVKGHALLFQFDINNYKKHVTLPNKTMGGIGSIACASVSVLCRSFIETIAVCSIHKKEKIENHILINANKEGSLKVELLTPQTEPMHVHRYAIEQMLIVGLQVVAQEYPHDIKLNIENK